MYVFCGCFSALPQPGVLSYPPVSQPRALASHDSHADRFASQILAYAGYYPPNAVPVRGLKSVDVLVHHCRINPSIQTIDMSGNSHYKRLRKVKAVVRSLNQVPAAAYLHCANQLKHEPPCFGTSLSQAQHERTIRCIRDLLAHPDRVSGR